MFLFGGVDDGKDIDCDILTGIYKRIKANEFEPGSDHVTQVMMVQSTIFGNIPVSASNLHLKVLIFYY
jgi:Sec7-like guanine-nucleotide exchange factor